MEKIQINFEKDIKPLLQESYTLRYVDYRDDLSGNLELIQKVIHNPENNDLEEELFDGFQEQEWEAVRIAKEELSEAIQIAFNIKEDEADEIIEENDDLIREAIEDRDDSNIMKDLFHNTGNQVFFYSTGTLIGDYAAPLKERLRDVKKALKIKLKNKEFDELIEQMCCQASYGGELVIYFTDSMEDWLDYNNENAGKKIEFSDFHVAIIDTFNSSGNDTYLTHTFSLPFNREMLFLCKTINYSYTYDVCRMSSNWCDGTKVLLKATKSKKALEKGQICKIQNEKLAYIETFRKGSCTAGDMDITRHRSTSYINNYLCGTRCSDCKTFWID